MLAIVLFAVSRQSERMSESTPKQSQMAREIGEIPEAVERFLAANSAHVSALARKVVADDPRFIFTVARGSSDHAATYLKYVSELVLGLPVASVGPSVASLYKARLRVENSLCVAVSQSGQSPDILALVEASRLAGAMTVAVTNSAQSPLAAGSAAVIDILAGPERSVAATKTFVSSCVAVLLLVAEMAGDRDLLDAIRDLPDALEKARHCDWTAVMQAIRPGHSLYAIGRGPSWAMSNEAALKLKETCQLHAESYSAAELLHGPVSIVNMGFPVLVFAAADAAEANTAEVADLIAAKGARVFATTGLVKAAVPLPMVRTGHPLADPLSLIVSFFGLAERIARELGIDPDAPRHLSKVTETT